MNIEEIDKWLDREYGVSYTSLERIHDWLCDREIEKDKEIERLNNIIKAIEKALKDNIEELKELTFSYDRIYEDKEILKLIQELKGSDKE